MVFIAGVFKSDNFYKAYYFNSFSSDSFSFSSRKNLFFSKKKNRKRIKYYDSNIIFFNSY